MKVVLATVPAEWRTKELLPPLSLGYLASALRNQGFEVVIEDTAVYCPDTQIATSEILKHRPDIVGITATTHNRFIALEVCKSIKRLLGIPVILGGCHFGMTAENVLENSAYPDVIVRNEGEITLPKLIESYDKKQNILGVQGITFKYDNGIFSAPDRPFIGNLDNTPPPAWDLFNHTLYKATLEGEYKEKAIGVISGRGCPNNCVFCANRALSHCVLRLRHPGNFVDELEFLQKEYGYRAFDIWDDTFTISRSRTLAICNEINHRGLDIIWYARARVNTVDKEMLERMQRAGCVSISYGVESGSPRILKEIRKGITLEQAEEAVKLSAQMGFYIKVFFMLSLPEETVEDIQLTVKFMDKLANYSNKIWCPAGYTLIYPGTDLDKPENLPENFEWNKYYYNKRNKEFRNNPTVPIYERKEMPLEEIKEIVRKHRGNLIRKASRGIGIIRNKLT